MTTKKSENICKSDVGTAFAIKPTKSSIDSSEHEADLETLRAKRANSAVEIPNEANSRRLANEDDGAKMSQDVSEEYSIVEGEPKPKPKPNNTPFPTPIIDSEDE